MRVRCTVALALAAATLTGLAATPAAARTQAPEPTGTVTVPDGRTLFADDRGRVLDLRGFNIDKYDETTEADVRSIAEHGFTLVRVAITWARLEPTRGRLDPHQLARLQQVLGWADRYGLRAVVDFHQDVYGPKYGGGDDGVPVWATRDDGLPFVPDPNDWFAGYFQPAVQAAFRHLYDDPDLRRWQSDFYTRLARELRGHRSLIGYDLFNEPFGPVDGDPSDPAVLAASSAELERGRLAGMYRRLIAAIRTVDTRSWLFVEPTVLVGQGVPTALPGFRDPRPGAQRIGYAPHFYSTPVEAGQDWDPTDGFVTAYTAAITAYPQAHHLPVLVGEWGPPDARRPGNRELVRQQTAAMSGFAAGWTMWYWCHGNGGYCGLGPDGRPAPGDEPVFAPYATALAGTPVSERFADGTYTLTFTADRTTAAGWTELAAPPTASVGGTPAVRRNHDGRIQLRFPKAHQGDIITLTVTP
ncbi:endoglycoceramidase [Kitasatospora sp. MMS16-BH015]|uniref:cellulase family glycosylhydrolase n=1 Tax=Kitasatospora sp. MMS16-BH015 TaxID=2018025 RepID=UPI000CA2A257|nr:cellulase family glycosylhydrolase [Kitasatospora sp. MMS16-BH015]AUG80031.1 endoglycoceramidase [Kitasatospora sp. MMS16-BH015]